MNVQRLSKEDISAFLNYCRRHEKDHDESFLSKTELPKFDSESEPTFLLKGENKIIGAVSLMPEPQGRIRIFHTEDGGSDGYRMLHKALTDHLRSVHEDHSYYMFITEEGNLPTISALEGLGLNRRRFIFVLERPHSPVADAVLPENYSLDPVRLPGDEEPWSFIRNEAMRHLPGHRFFNADHFSKMNEAEGFLENCTLILRHGDIPVGIIKAERDEQSEGLFGFIGPIAVLPEYQGRGLGRIMLRTVLTRISIRGWQTSLCVNSDNEDALKLYLEEGFERTETVQELVYAG